MTRARRPQTVSPLDGRKLRQGAGHSARPAPIADRIGYAGLLLGLFALASMGLSAIPYLTTPAASTAPATSAAVEDAAGRGGGE